MQQINLYQPILRKQEKVFSAKTLLQGNLLVLGALVLLSAYTLYQTMQLQAQLDEAAQQRNERVQRLAALQAQYPQRVRDNTLSQRVEELRKQVQNSEALLGAVEAYEDRPARGYSERLTGLARQDLRSLWLTRIVMRGQNQLLLEGSALSAEDVPVLIQRLGEEPHFGGITFERVEIQANDKTGQVDFTLNTTRKEEQGSATGRSGGAQ